MKLSTFVAGSRTVSIAGEEREAARLTVRSVGILEGFFELVAAHIEGDRPDDPSEEWPPTLGSPGSIRLLGTTEGFARLLHASLSIASPGFTLDEARELAGTMDDAEQTSFTIAVFPEPVARPPDDPNRPQRPRQTMDWVGGVKKLCRDYHCSVEECLDMPIDRFFGMMEDSEAERSPFGGPKKTWKIPINGPADLDRMWREHEARMGGGKVGDDGIGESGATP